MTLRKFQFEFLKPLFKSSLQDMESTTPLSLMTFVNPFHRDQEDLLENTVSKFLKDCEKRWDSQLKAQEAKKAAEAQKTEKLRLTRWQSQGERRHKEKENKFLGRRTQDNRDAEGLFEGGEDRQNNVMEVDKESKASGHSETVKVKN